MDQKKIHMETNGRRCENKVDEGPSFVHTPFEDNENDGNFSKLVSKNKTKMGKEVMGPKITFIFNQMKLQNFGLPKTNLNYILKIANGQVMKKFQRTCKYFYQRNPYFIVDEIKYDEIKIDDKCFTISDVSMVSNIWVLNVFHFGKKEFLQKVVRCDAKSISLPSGVISTNLFDIYTKSNCVKYWYSFSTNVKSYDENDISIEELFYCLPNAESIGAIVKSSPKLATTELRKTKIKELRLCISDNTFDSNEYYEFFEKVLAPKATVWLNFKCPNEASKLSLDKFKELREIIGIKWKPTNHKPKILYSFMFSNSI